MSGNEFTTPVGRLVQGDPFKANTTNMKGKPLTNTDGSPRVEYFVAIAVAKTDPGWPVLWAQLQAVGQAGFPGGQSQRTDFSWKIIDGDNAVNAKKEGFAGHWVLRFTNGFPPTIYTKDGLEVIVDPNGVKRGDYVRVYGDAVANGKPDAGEAGIYLNWRIMELIGYGEAIQSGPDGKEIFGGANSAALPAGASTTPVASNTPIAGNQAGGPGGPGGAQQAAGGPGGPGGPGGAPTGPGGPGAAQQAAPQHVMTDKQQWSYDEQIAAGHTDATLIAEGLMVDPNAGVAANSAYMGNQPPV